MCSTPECCGTHGLSRLPAAPAIRKTQARSNHAFIATSAQDASGISIRTADPTFFEDTDDRPKAHPGVRFFDIERAR